MLISFFMPIMIDTRNYFNFTQKLPLFANIYSFMDILMAMVKEEILTTFFEVLGQARQLKKLTNQAKELVNQNIDLNKWKLRGIFLIIFNTPVLPLATTKTKYS